jgi:hypothetical protein
LSPSDKHTDAATGRRKEGLMAPTVTPIEHRPMAPTVTPIEHRPPSEPGALDSYTSSCSCGLVMRSSLRSLVLADVAHHVAWHARKGH